MNKIMIKDLVVISSIMKIKSNLYTAVIAIFSILFIGWGNVGHRIINTKTNSLAIIIVRFICLHGKFLASIIWIF